jgi:hypothetical protein
VAESGREWECIRESGREWEREGDSWREGKIVRELERTKKFQPENKEE